jgi:hypothetical protein
MPQIKVGNSTVNTVKRVNSSGTVANVKHIFSPSSESSPTKGEILSKIAHSSTSVVKYNFNFGNFIDVGSHTYYWSGYIGHSFSFGGSTVNTMGAIVGTNAISEASYTGSTPPVISHLVMRHRQTGSALNTEARTFLTLKVPSGNTISNGGWNSFYAQGLLYNRTQATFSQSTYGSGTATWEWYHGAANVISGQWFNNGATSADTFLIYT